MSKENNEIVLKASDWPLPAIYYLCPRCDFVVRHWTGLVQIGFAVAFVFGNLDGEHQKFLDHFFEQLLPFLPKIQVHLDLILQRSGTQSYETARGVLAATFLFAAVTVPLSIVAAIRVILLLRLPQGTTVNVNKPLAGSILFLSPCLVFLIDRCFTVVRSIDSGPFGGVPPNLLLAIFDLAIVSLLSVGLFQILVLIGYKLRTKSVSPASVGR